MRRPKSRPAYVPEHIWAQCRHLILVCDTHQNWALAGTCSACKDEQAVPLSARYPGVKCPDAPYGVDTTPRSDQPLQPIPDPYGLDTPRLRLAEGCDCVLNHDTGALVTPCEGHQRQAERGVA
jgi:hypothetical protein